MIGQRIKVLADGRNWPHESYEFFSELSLWMHRESRLGFVFHAGVAYLGLAGASNKICDCYVTVTAPYHICDCYPLG